MKIAVTSQNFRTITGHAGKARRFIVFEAGADGTPQQLDRLDLPKDMSMHEFRGEDHPVFAFDVVITAGCGDGFAHRMSTHGVTIVTTSESDPQTAVAAYLRGDPLPPAAPHEH